jgi:hypothetical protein
MSAHDLKIRSGGVLDTIGKEPYFRTVGIDSSTADGPQVFVNNSLEGSLFDDGGTGKVTVAGGDIHPNFNLDYTSALSAPVNIVDGVAPAGLVRTDNIVSVNIIGHGLVANDVFSISGITFDDTHEYQLNGVYRVFQKIDADHFTFVKKGSDFAKTYYTYPMAVVLTKYASATPVIKLFDNRQPADASGLSYSGLLLTPLDLATLTQNYRKIVPSDLYLRFKVIDSTEELGGLNSNIFNVIDDTTQENVKPIIWAYFFGGLTKVTDGNFSTADRTPANNFDILFNSYAVVLRPTGDGSRLEFALLKFNWGEIIEANWFTNYIDTPLINKYDDVDGADLGYLISANPNVATISEVSKITEIATSSSFAYDSEKPLKFNLKISIKKHLLSDQATDNSYYFQLAISNDYDSFGDAAVYSNIMHAYIQRPRTNGYEVTIFQAGGYVNPIASDLGKDVMVGGNPVGTLQYYDNTNRIWWIRGVASTITSGSVLSIDSGTGAGTTNINSYDDSSLQYVNPLNTDATDFFNYVFMPWIYFKFINLNATDYQADSSIIQMDNVLFRQMNSDDKNYF